MSDEVKRFLAIGSNASVHAICDRVSRGEVAVCPRCKSDLHVALTWDQAIKLDMHPGIVCPTDKKHFEVIFNIASKVPIASDGTSQAVTAKGPKVSGTTPVIEQQKSF